jgi:serine/threonine protein kinase
MSVPVDLPGDGPPADDDSFVRDASPDSYDDVQVNPLAVLRAEQVLCERFRVEHLARRGGMGAIYKGLDQKTGRPVAIKIMGSLGRGLRARFARETRILAELSHPGIVRHLSHGTTPDGTLFLVMGWLDGEDLSVRLARQPLSLDESLMLLRFVCQALDVAHASGIIHRDIKPANLFLTSSDPRSVKLLDFGIARLAVPAAPLTTGAALLGTLGYMAPEQAMAQRDLDARADVFALGCVLYECVTGRAPFASADQVAVLAKVLREELPDIAQSRERTLRDLSRGLRTGVVPPEEGLGLLLDQLSGIIDYGRKAESRPGTYTTLDGRPVDGHFVAVGGVFEGFISTDGAIGAYRRKTEKGWEWKESLPADRRENLLKMSRMLQGGEAPGFVPVPFGLVSGGEP